jgi:hypothetical protein
MCNHCPLTFSNLAAKVRHICKSAFKFLLIIWRFSNPIVSRLGTSGRTRRSRWSARGARCDSRASWACAGTPGSTPGSSSPTPALVPPPPTLVPPAPALAYLPAPGRTQARAARPCQAGVCIR